MSKIRAKFRVNLVTPSSVGLHPVYTGSPENAEFYKQTPAGSIILGLVRKDVVDAFTVGQEFYVDFTPAE